MHSTLTVQDRLAVVMTGKAVSMAVVVLDPAARNVRTSLPTVTVPAQSVPDNVTLHRKDTAGLVPVKTRVAADGPEKRVQLACVTRYAVDFNPGTTMHHHRI
jgi:hypothetical protein